VSDKGIIDLSINALPVDIRKPLQRAFYELLDNFRFGSGRRAQNAQLYRITATTHADANTEFAIAHGLGSAPTQVFPIVDLKSIGSQLVPLQVSRAADATNLYLRSTSTGAVVTLFVEG
jgi:hypothetical protein